MKRVWRRCIGWSIVTTLIVSLASIPPAAASVLSYTRTRATVIGKTYEPARHVRTDGARELWDDEDYVVSVRQCKSTTASGGTRCSWRTTRVYMTQQEWNSRAVGDSCINVTKTPCELWWGGTIKDPLVSKSITV